MANKILVTGTSVRADLLKPLSDAGFVVENPTHLLSESELKEHLKNLQVKKHSQPQTV
jgi:hypothetical protein